MLRVTSAVAALALALGLAPSAALAGQEKPAFEHVHALAATADGRQLFLGAHTGLYRTNPKVMYVAMLEGIFRSENVGGAWTRVAAGPKNVAAVAVNPKRPSQVYAATVDGKIYRSEDEGARWDEAR